MSVTVANNRFITSSLRVGFYQQLLRGVSTFQELGNRLVKRAEAAFYLRQIDSLKEFGSLLSNLPIKEYQLIGQYYLGWCEYYNGANEAHIFENVLENSTAYRPNALMSLAAIEARKGNYASEGYFFMEAMKYTTSITAFIKASKGLAIVKAKEGFHKLAIKDLENLLPIIRHAEPIVYFNFLNSYAVELGEVGRIEEARNVCRIILASPFAFAYPEWHETSDEIERKGYCQSRSVSFIQKKSENVSYLSERERSEGHRRSPFFQPRGVTKIADWKKKMVKEPNGNGEESEDMTPQEMAMKIVEIITQNKGDEENLRKLMEYAKNLFPK